MASQSVATATVRRDPKTGRLLPGSTLNPGGVTQERILKERLAALSRKILDEEEGKQTLFERTVRALLHPVICARKPGWKEKYLVNDRSILATLEFLTRRGYGGDPKEDDIEKPAAGGVFSGMTVIIRVERPRPPRAAIDTTARLK